MTSSADVVLNAYVSSYRDLIETEQLDDGSVVLSFPFHLAANHRIEITVTKRGNSLYLISDSARTIGEVQAVGHKVTAQMMERLEKIARASDLRLVDTTFILESSFSDLGLSIQKFLEMTKTVGDVYLVHKQKERADQDVISQVQGIFDSRNLHYRIDEKITGELEMHSIDLVVPRNGHPGFALSVISGQNTHTVAQVWGYKCEDIKRGEWYQSNKPTLALVYDVRNQVWSEASRSILTTRADVVVPSDSLGSLQSELISRFPEPKGKRKANRQPVMPRPV
jgi:hypothetical protein